MAQHVFGNRQETVLHAAPRRSSRAVNHVLLGSILRVHGEDTSGDWFEVDALGRGAAGWVHKADVRDDPILKIYFVDVGQGDGAIVESPEGVMLVDGGPNSSFYRFMTHRYRNILRAGFPVRIRALVMSHPDYDHFNGLTAVLRDDRFIVDTIYHNGIIRYDDANLPPGRDFDLGRRALRQVGGTTVELLTATFDGLEEAEALIADGHLMPSFRKFWQAALDARAGGRLNGAMRLTSRVEALPGYEGAGPGQLRAEVLGPVPTATSGPVDFVTFPKTEDIAKAMPRASSSHTRNGHSVVLKLTFGAHSVLLGGDLNIPAQRHLMQHYGSANPFRVDVAKACHHGSSDYLVDYLKQVLPQANVFSSGDNTSFDHPMADALGATGRHTRGDHPLLFSTELARAESGSGTHYGLVNLRSNGDVLVMAQMKEQHRNKADVWDSFSVPWPGRFHPALDESEG